MGGKRKKSKKQSGANSPSVLPHSVSDEKPEFFIDECVARYDVAGVLEKAGYRTHAHGDVTLATGTPDTEWLPFIGKRNWVLITKDNKIKRNRIELRALTHSKVRAFFMTGKGLKSNAQADVIEKALPAMMRLLRRAESPFIARITAHSAVDLITKKTSKA